MNAVVAMAPLEHHELEKHRGTDLDQRTLWSSCALNVHWTLLDLDGRKAISLHEMFLRSQDVVTQPNILVARLVLLAYSRRRKEALASPLFPSVELSRQSIISFGKSSQRTRIPEALLSSNCL